MRPPDAKKKPKRKITLSQELLEVIAGRFKVLAEPARLRILHALQPGELTVSQLLKATGYGQANVSKHLAVLAAAGMVGRRKAGQNAHYSITDPVVFEICELVCNKMQLALPARAAGRSPSK